MINYVEKGSHLHTVLLEAGYKVGGAGNMEAFDLLDNQSEQIDAAVQAIIDSYDPLPLAREDATARINQAAGAARLKYGTDIPYQQASYEKKLADCIAFKEAGYPENDIEDYIYVNARAERQGVTGETAANEIIAIAAQWEALLFQIENGRDAANEAVAEADTVEDINVIADAFVSAMDAI